jgi:hypothetical protein
MGHICIIFVFFMSSVSQDILLYGWGMDATGLGFCLKAGFSASGIESFGFPMSVSYFITFCAVSTHISCHGS